MNAEEKIRLQQFAIDIRKLIIREMTEDLVLELVAKGLKTDQIVLTLGYDAENLRDDSRAGQYTGEVKADRYGRKVPKSAHGSQNLDAYTSSGKMITEAAMQLADKIIDSKLLVRRIYVVFSHVLPEGEIPAVSSAIQPDLFSYAGQPEDTNEETKADLEREKRLQHSVLEIRERFGKNAVFKGTSLLENSTHLERNGQIGGHRA